jgi:GNAT superfamily N-acetyltransferase
MDIEIKSLNNEIDLTDAFEFITKELNLKPDHPRDLNFYKKQLSTYPQFLIYAEYIGEKVGVLLAFPNDEDSILIGELAVVKAHRGRGIGSKLIKEIEDRARTFKKKSILLGALGKADNFYLKNGYKPMLFIQLSDGNRLDELKTFSKENNCKDNIAWEESTSESSKIIIETNFIDKDLQDRAEKIPNSHTQYLFTKDL